MILGNILENVEEEVKELLITTICQDKNSYTLNFVITRTHTYRLLDNAAFVRIHVKFFKHFLQIF